MFVSCVYEGRGGGVGSKAGLAGFAGSTKVLCAVCRGPTSSSGRLYSVSVSWRVVGVYRAPSGIFVDSRASFLWGPDSNHIKLLDQHA